MKTTKTNQEPDTIRKQKTKKLDEKSLPAFGHRALFQSCAGKGWKLAGAKTAGLLVSEYWFLVDGLWLLVSGCWILVMVLWLPVVGFWL